MFVGAFVMPGTSNQYMLAKGGTSANGEFDPLAATLSLEIIRLILRVFDLHVDNSLPSGHRLPPTLPRTSTEEYRTAIDRNNTHQLSSVFPFSFHSTGITALI